MSPAASTTLAQSRPLAGEHGPQSVRAVEPRADLGDVVLPREERTQPLQVDLRPHPQPTAGVGDAVADDKAPGGQLEQRLGRRLRFLTGEWDRVDQRLLALAEAGGQDAGSTH